MEELDLILHELAAIQAQTFNPATDLETRARLSWRRHELHARAAQLARSRHR